MLTHSVYWIKAIAVCVCVADCFLRERVFCFCFSLSISLFAAIWTSMQTLLLHPKACWVAMDTAVITQPKRCKHWEKRELSFLLSFFKKKTVESLTLQLFFLPVHIMLHKNPDLLLTWGFFMWMREWKQEVNFGPSWLPNVLQFSKWAHSDSCWSRSSTAPSVYKKHLDWMTGLI